MNCKKMKKIFLIFSVFTFAILTTVSVRAADNGCTNDNNEFINQAVALCTTHAYNIGETYNPADKQEMNDIIALKTTIMTQQMKKQYDFLDVTVKRLKTQLQKSILTAKVQAAGGNATDDSSNTTNKSSNKNIKLNGARDCNEVYSTSDMLACLNNNLSTIRSSSDKTNARKQLEFDASLLKSLTTSLKLESAAFDKCTSSMTNSDITTCMNAYQAQLRLANDNLKTNSSGKQD